MSAKKRRNKSSNALYVAAIVVTVVALATAAAFLSPKFNRRAGVTPTPPPAQTTVPPESSTPTATPTATPAETPSPTPEPTPEATPTPSATTPQGDRRSTRKLKEPVKALFLNATSVRKNLDHYIELANKTEINAYVIDIKNDSGVLMYDSEIPLVNEAKADTPGFDIREVTKKLHDNNIMVIARMVTFKDNTITKHRPDLAIKKASGEVFEGSKTRWLDPTNKDTWDYIVSIAQEAVQFGFDEIQFDYIRFPETTLYDYTLNLKPDQTRHGVIEEFIRYTRNKLPEDTILSADIFGMPMIATKDYGEIGQSLETIGWSLDAICPMIYPSHYANNAPKGSMSNKVGQTINGIKFTHPDLKPYDVVYNTLVVGKERIEKVEGYNLNVRAYIQGFTASYLPEGYWKTYGVDEYRAQIQAVYDAGYTEWIFWNSPNTYVEAAFLPE